jgi:hypothetical protein
MLQKIFWMIISTEVSNRFVSYHAEYTTKIENNKLHHILYNISSYIATNNINAADKES